MSKHVPQSLDAMDIRSVSSDRGDLLDFSPEKSGLQSADVSETDVHYPWFVLSDGSMPPDVYWARRRRLRKIAVIAGSMVIAVTLAAVLLFRRDGDQFPSFVSLTPPTPAPVGTIAANPPPEVVSQPPIRQAQGTTPPVSAPAPPVSALPPPVSAPEPRVDAAPPPVVTKPPVEIAKSPVEIAKPPVEVAKPAAEVAKPPVAVTKPAAEVAKPPVAVTKPPVAVAKPPAEITKPPVAVAKPPVEAAKPRVEAPPPPRQTAVPPRKDPAPQRLPLPRPLSQDPARLSAGVAPPSSSSSPPASAEVTPAPPPAPAPSPSPPAATLSTPSVTPAPSAAPPVTAAASPTPAPANVPAPSPAAAPAAAASVVNANTAGIQNALTRYRRAYSSLDANAVRAVWPTVDQRTLSRAFERLEQQQVVFDNCRIDVNNSERAQATCSGTARYVPRVGSRSPREDQREWRFSMVKKSDEWFIGAVDTR